MPLIRIDLIEERTEEQLAELTQAVHDSVLEDFGARPVTDTRSSRSTRADE